MKKRLRLPSLRQVGGWIVSPFAAWYTVLRKSRENAPHKSFVRSRQRDRIKTPHVEGYVAFPWYVARTLWRDKWLYGRFLLLFVFLFSTLLGVMQVTNIGMVSQLIDAANTADTTLIGPVMKATIVVSSSLAGALTNNLSDIQLLLLSTLFFFTVLVTIWLVRLRMAGKRVRVRDGIYTAGGPVLALYVLAVVGLLQLIPLSIAALIYLTASTTGWLNGGIEAAMFGGALFCVAIGTLYFMTTTFFAMLIAATPGTYPLDAYSLARRIVAGQRLRLVMRLLWLLFLLVVGWFLFLVPVVIVTNSFAGQNSLVIPLAIQTTIGASLIYGTAYMYLLYRRMIDAPVDKK